MNVNTNNHAADTKPVVINNRQFYSRLFNIALPIMVQQLMLALVAAGDALMLGQVAQEQMTAVSLASQIQFIQNMILAAFTMAGSILGAQYWGKGDKKTIQSLFHLMLRWAGAVSILFFAACELVPGFLMSIFTNDKALMEIGILYLRIAGFSYLITGISQCYLAVMKVTDHVPPSAWIPIRRTGLPVASSSACRRSTSVPSQPRLTISAAATLGLRPRLMSVSVTRRRSLGSWQQPW